MFVLSNPPRLSVLGLPKTQDRIYLFADDVHVADACAHQFYADALARLQTLEPTTASLGPQEGSPTGALGNVPYKVVAFVARANACPPGTASVVDLMDLESRIMAKCDPSSSAIFDPEEYPGLVWLDVGGARHSAPDLMTDIGSDIEFEMKTLVFPSGAMVVHGSNMDKMEKSLKQKLPLIQKCMRSVPESIASLFKSNIAS